jgi:hypothetical protein
MDSEKEHAQTLQATAAALVEGKLPTTEQALDALEALKETDELKTIHFSETGKEVILNPLTVIRYPKILNNCWKIQRNS